MVRIPDEDPLSVALAPPPDETDEQRARRVAAEEAARRVSEEIDEQLRVERAAMKKKKRPIKVLLLGQSESGECSAQLLCGVKRGWTHNAGRGIFPLPDVEGRGWRSIPRRPA